MLANVGDALLGDGRSELEPRVGRDAPLPGSRSRQCIGGVQVAAAAYPISVENFLVRGDRHPAAHVIRPVFPGQTAIRVHCVDAV